MVIYDGCSCPKCGSGEHLEFLHDNGDVHISDGMAWQDWKCGGCGAHWRDMYAHLTSVMLDINNDETGEMYHVDRPANVGQLSNV